jgi:hypothetical protein
MITTISKEEEIAAQARMIGLLKGQLAFSLAELVKITVYNIELGKAIRDTITENLDLADGDDCILKRLKEAIGFELPDDEDGEEMDLAWDWVVGIEKD